MKKYIKIQMAKIANKKFIFKPVAFKMRKISNIVLYIGLILPIFAVAQDADTTKTEQVILIADMQLQIDIGGAMNDLYNFEFSKAEQQFRWIKQKYPWHPLPYFLMGLSKWWRIMPEPNETKYDDVFLSYMDSVIMVAEHMHKSPSREIEAAFFLAAAYGFKGRLYSEEDRKNWRKAAVAGKNALKYMEECRGMHDLSPELLFGDGLYNYFSVWVPENYPLLKPLLVFFSKGDKELGIKQLKEVSYNAFYTRTEAQVFLMRILNNYENEPDRALQISEYLHQTYPNNPYFHRYYVRMLYTMGKYRDARPIAEDIIAKIDSGAVGYGATSGRYASFFLGEIYKTGLDFAAAKKYYERTITFALSNDETGSGYYHYALLYLGDIAWKEGDAKQAREYYKEVKKEADRSDTAYDRAKERLKRL